MITETPKPRKGLYCPRCGKKFDVLKTRGGNQSIRRRRKCRHCPTRVWTEEKIIHVG